VASEGSVVVPWSAASDARRREVIAPDAVTGTPAKSMPSDVRRTLLVSIAKARLWMRELTSGRMDLAGIASREGRSERSVRMLLPLAGLAPEIVEAAMHNRLPDGFGVSRLIADLPLSWAEQRRTVGLGRSVAVEHNRQS
jgi:ParB-like chromosome segregation protein Spo0J